jgi:predicted MPP superfamily phosphohydrolase
VLPIGASNAAVALSTATDLALALFLVFRGLRIRDERVTILRVATSALAVAAFVLAKMIGAKLMGRTWFFAVHLAYVDVMVLLPLIGGALLAAALRRRATPSVGALGCASFALVPIGIHSTFVAPYDLRVESCRVPLASAREGVRPITIGVLSDIQCTEIGTHERAAVARVMDAHPDLILLPGDLMQVSAQRIPDMLPSLHALLAELSAPLGVYFVQGNCESKSDARRFVEGTPVRFLDDEVVTLAIGDRRVRVCGVDLAFASPRARAALESLERAGDDGDVRIVLAHRPDVIDALPKGSRVDLIVCGHTHGGQVQLPLYGPPITLSSVPRAIAAGGLHEQDGKRIYLSRGVGWEHGDAPRVRFLCPPEVSLLTLESR